MKSIKLIQVTSEYIVYENNRCTIKYLIELTK